MTTLFPELEPAPPPAPPPLDDWVNHGHEVVGRNPGATYRREVEGTWQRWDYDAQEWRDEWPQP